MPWSGCPAKWVEMKGSLQRKKTKKFAKYIVEAVATLQQKGFVWYANKTKDSIFIVLLVFGCLRS